MLQPSPPALLWGGYATGSDKAGFCGGSVAAYGLASPPASLRAVGRLCGVSGREGSVAVMAIKTAHAYVAHRECAVRMDALTFPWPMNVALSQSRRFARGR